MKEFILTHMIPKKKFVMSIIALVLVGAMFLASCSSNDIVSNGNASSDSGVSNESKTSGAASEVSDASGSEANAYDESDINNNDNSTANSEASNDNVSDASQDEPEPSESPNGNESNIDSSELQTSSTENSVSNSNGSNSNEASTHTHSHKKMEVLPTCTEKGYTKNVCYCGDYYITDEKPTVKHNMAYDSTTAPTETTRGKYVYKCSYGCGYTVVEEIYSYNEYAALLVPYVLQSINEYRAKEGAPAVKLSNAQTRYSQYRAKQLISNFDHSFADSCVAAEATHVGVYYSDYIDPIDNVFFSAHWIGQYYGEVIQKGYIQSYQTVKSGKTLQDDLEKTAQAIIQAFWNSQAHKDILAEKTDFQIYVGIGIYMGHVCINLDLDNTQDEFGYQHCWYDNDFFADGGQFHQCYEYVKDGAPQFKCINPKHKK